MNLIGAKIYSDGSNYIAIPHTERPYRKRNTPPPPTDEQAETVEKFTKFFNKKKGKRKTRKAQLLKEMLPLFKEETEATEFVEKHFERLSRNRWERYKRMKRRAYNYIWSYFVTFTYANEKQTEETFKKQLKNCLYHLSNRKGWRYIGAWERGEKGQRLHFHALIYIPPNAMVGKLETVKEYSTKRHKWEEKVLNTFFGNRFGKTEFDEIHNQYEVADSIVYMLKYITKNDERVVYSRGLKTYFVSDILDEDILCHMGDEEHGFQYILAPNFKCIVDGEILGTVSPEIIENMPKSN